MRDTKSKLIKKRPTKYSKIGLSKAFSNREMNILKRDTVIKRTANLKRGRERPLQTKRLWLVLHTKNGKRERWRRISKRERLREWNADRE